MAACGISSGAAVSEEPKSAIFADVALRDQEGQAVLVGQLHGKTLVLNFLFASCPSVCPLQTRELARLQQAIEPALRARVQFLSVSVDPVHDTPAVLKQFAAAHGARLDNWRFASAPPRDTALFTSRLGALDPRKPDDFSAHGTSIYLFDARGRLMQRYAGAPVDSQRLLRDIQQLDRLRGREPPT
jgi:protein SCO1/2